MKKLVMALVAMTMTASAFAAGENMVRFYGWDSGARSNSVDVAFDTTTNTDGTEDADSSSNNFAVNYARAFGQWQVGITYKSDADSNGIDNTIGLSGYYNLESDLMNTCYFAFHYDMMTASNDDKTNTMTLEYGHRWLVGSAWGLNLTYAPSVAISQAVTAYDNDALEDETEVALGWNFLKFDVLF